MSLNGTLAGFLGPVLRPLLPVLLSPACRRGFPKRLRKVQGIHCPLPAVWPLPAQSHPGRLSQQLRKSHFSLYYSGIRRMLLVNPSELPPLLAALFPLPRAPQSCMPCDLWDGDSRPT